MILWVVFAQVMLLIAVNLLHIIFFFWWPGTLQGLKSLDPTLKIKSLIEWRTEAVRFFRKLSSNKKYWCIWSLKGSLYLITDPRGSTHCFQTSNTENRFWKHLMAFELHDQQTDVGRTDWNHKVSEGYLISTMNHHPLKPLMTRFHVPSFWR